MNKDLQTSIIVYLKLKGSYESFEKERDELIQLYQLSKAEAERILLDAVEMHGVKIRLVHYWLGLFKKSFDDQMIWGHREMCLLTGQDGMETFHTAFNQTIERELNNQVDGITQEALDKTIDLPKSL